MLKFAPIMPTFCSLLYTFYYSNNLCGNIDTSLQLARFEILLLNIQGRFKNLNVGETLQKYLDGLSGNCLTAATLQKSTRGRDRHQ